MKGLELAEKFYNEYGKPMIESEFSAYADRIAVGLVGHGSECFGYDDDISLDHDFAPSFNIWIDDEDDAVFGFKLFRAYSKLPKEFIGVKLENESAFGNSGKGVSTISDFYSFYTSTGKAPESNREWLSIPDFYLAEATNGKVFYDPLGKFSKIREKLLNGMPEDVRLKKLASNVFNMAQSGQYNYARCLSHGEKTASAVALTEFVKSTAYAIFNLNKKHAPYYKWLFRAMKDLPILGNISVDLENLLLSPYDKETNQNIIERICALVISEIKAQGLSEREDEYLEPYAYCITNKIKDGELRNSPVIL